MRTRTHAYMHTHTHMHTKCTYVRAYVCMYICIEGNWEDIDCGWQSLVQIIDHWGQYGKYLSQYAGPGHWHDPDMLLIGNNCLTTFEEQSQMALWAISAAPLIMGNDLRNISAVSKAILQNKDAIAVDQDPLGKMGYRVNMSADGHGQVWARALSDGAVAVGAYNKGGGTPSGVTLVESGAYCANATGVDNKQSFGYTLASCAAAVGMSDRCVAARAVGGIFYYSEGYNGQCTCAKDACTTRHQMGTYSIYKLSPGTPALGADVTVHFDDLVAMTAESGATASGADKGRGSSSHSSSSGNVGGGGDGFAAAASSSFSSSSYKVYDIWQGKDLGTFKDTFVAKNVGMHGTGFFRLTPVTDGSN